MRHRTGPVGLLQGISCGAITEDEALVTGLTLMKSAGRS
jgi:hypothetical protein